MTALVRNVANIAPKTFVEDALGLVAICVIIFAGLCIPAVT